jgi:general secretion pathway protein L
MENKVQLIKIRQLFSRFIVWWLHELSAFIPPSVRHWYFGRGNVLTVQLEAALLVFKKLQLTSLTEIGRIDLKDVANDQRKGSVQRYLNQITNSRIFRLYLCLPPDRMLRKQLHLPLATEENIRQTLAFELDRQTPFKPDQLYFDYKIIDRLETEQVLLVELIVLPKDIVEDHIRQAAILGLPITAAVLEQDILRYGDKSPNFLPALMQPKSSRRRIWLNFGFFSIALALMTMSIVVPLWHKREQAIVLNGLVLEAKMQAARTDVLRTQLDELVAEHNFPVDQKNTRVSTLVLLNELSKLLPDDTWISLFELNGTDLQIQGETGSSSKLIEAIENSGLVKGASYKSPLTQIPGTAMERFHLAAATRSPSSDEKASASAADSRDSTLPQSKPVSATTVGAQKDAKPNIGGGS